ncbi:hypothetical protein B9Z55_011800 [Caenorhabditis nigoni]|uniref:Uncharacterized protein n=2 Tax=Caenorhabditis nigoni TaxID=1611254 RepID=A0A2G5ULR0_9PELO|nr:hypothetical protein B9Z55_011800 [Caenorhabditis nigoni]
MAWMTRGELQKELEEYDESYESQVEKIYIRRAMIAMIKLKGGFSDLTKDERTRHCQIVKEHMETLLKPPEPVLDYSKMTKQELLEHWNFINVRQEALIELYETRDDYTPREEESSDRNKLKEAFSYMCNLVKTKVTESYTTIVKMIWEEREIVELSSY